MALRKIRISTILILGLFLTSGAFALRISGQTDAEQITDLEGINVAVYGGVGTVSHCTTALVSLFEWLNASVDRIRTESIFNGSLENYEIVAYPGGNMLAYATELGDNGTKIIREFVYKAEFKQDKTDTNTTKFIICAAAGMLTISNIVTYGLFSKSAEFQGKRVTKIATEPI